MSSPSGTSSRISTVTPLHPSSLWEGVKIHDSCIYVEKAHNPKSNLRPFSPQMTFNLRHPFFRHKAYRYIDAFPLVDCHCTWFLSFVVPVLCHPRMYWPVPFPHIFHPTALAPGGKLGSELSSLLLWSNFILESSTLVEEQRATIILTHKQSGGCCRDEVSTCKAAFPFTFFDCSYPYTFLLSLQLFNFVFQPIPFYKQFLWVFITIYFLQVLFMVQDASPSLLSAPLCMSGK